MLKLKFYLPAIGWTIIIFLLSIGNTPINAPIQWISIDKLGHLTFYMLEVVLMIWGLAKANNWQKTKHIPVVVCFIIAVSYGTLLEYVQAILPHRTFDYADMVANLVGATIGVLFYYSTKNKLFINQ